MSLRLVTRRTIISLVALLCASGLLGWRVYSLRRPAPKIQLLGRAYELWYVRNLAKRISAYAEEYGRPVYRFDVREGRYAVNTAAKHITPAESLQVAELRYFLFTGNVGYGFDSSGFYVSWPAIEPRVIAEAGWPAAAAEYARERRMSVAPRRRGSTLP